MNGSWALWQFAIFKTTGALHSMSQGAVSDDPIWTPEEGREYADKRTGRTAFETLADFADYPGGLDRTMRFTRREIREVVALLRAAQ